VKNRPTLGSVNGLLVMVVHVNRRFEMARFKLSISLLALLGVYAVAATSFAQSAPKPRCGFNGNYTFYFWDPGKPATGVGYFAVKLDPDTKCRSGVVLPGGILNCHSRKGIGFEDFIESGTVSLESDGQGTMLFETNSSDGICGTGTNALELDISVVLGGKTVLFNSNAAEDAASGTTPQAGYFGTITGKADRCFAGDISGCYDVRFWFPVGALVGDCTICVEGGLVTGGTCRCNTNDISKLGGFETLSEIETGGYTLGENCQSSTGFLSFTVSSDEVCDITSTIYLDFGVAQQGAELIGECDPINGFGCSFEGWKQ
jgi:hypothetical protein